MNKLNEVAKTMNKTRGNSGEAPVLFMDSNGKVQSSSEARAMSTQALMMPGKYFGQATIL